MIAPYQSQNSIKRLCDILKESSIAKEQRWQIAEQPSHDIKIETQFLVWLLCTERGAVDGK